MELLAARLQAGEILDATVSEDALPQLLPVITSLFAVAAAILLATVVVWAARGATREGEQVEQLAARLRRLCESTGRPEIRTRRPRLLSRDAQTALRSLDRSLRSLESHQGIRSRRLPLHRPFLGGKALIGDLEQRISRLEQRGLR